MANSEQYPSEATGNIERHLEFIQGVIARLARNSFFDQRMDTHLNSRFSSTRDQRICSFSFGRCIVSCIFLLVARWLLLIPGTSI